MWLEWAGLFFVLPALLALGWIRPPLWLALGAPALVGGAWLLASGGWDLRRLWHGTPSAERRRLPTLLLRVAVGAALLLALLAAVYPDRLFELPTERPVFWAALVLSYPVVSVYPQELVYRAFFFRRYLRLFPGRRAMICASALAFAWMHLVFGNGWALLFTLVGGLFFAQTFAHTGSLRLVWLEHSLYGVLLFSFGWDEFFLYRPG